MSKVSNEIMQEIWRMLEKYERTVENSPLKPSAKDTYLGHARQFVRWVADEFEPGTTKR